ncbi:BPI fold-containing family A member 2 [Apodemus speciosus]|uniref:BPI fold-containing family A member 2 n=1 Tax=Apodemus speciosus TaxID=105296 RepID=A0ABQ0EJW9_APOSI
MSHNVRATSCKWGLIPILGPQYKATVTPESQEIVQRNKDRECILLQSSVSGSKMFQLGSLVVLCGLLIGTSRSLSGTEITEKQLLEEQESSVHVVLENFQRSQKKVAGCVFIFVGSQGQSAGSFGKCECCQLNRHFISNRCEGLEVKDLRLLDVKPSLSSSGDEVTMKIPMTLDATMSLPVPDLTLDISTSMEMVSKLAVQKDDRTGLFFMNMQTCSANVDKISVSSSGRQNSFINLLLNNVSDSVRRNLLFSVTNGLCPILREIFKNLQPSLIFQSGAGNLHLKRNEQRRSHVAPC